MKFSFWIIGTSMIVASLIMIVVRWFNPATFDGNIPVVMFAFGAVIIAAQEIIKDKYAP